MQAGEARPSATANTDPGIEKLPGLFADQARPVRYIMRLCCTAHLADCAVLSSGGSHRQIIARSQIPPAQL